MNAVTDITMDKETFYRWSERQERRFELVDGRAVMMNGVTRDHARIVGNITKLLMALVDGERLDVLSAEFAVEIGDTVRYPDIMVCERESDGKTRHGSRPVLLIEILSETSLFIDLNDKAREYTSLPTLGTYAVLSQDGAKAWVWTRAGAVMPERPVEVFGLDTAIDVPALGLALTLADVYRTIELKQ